MIKSSTLLLRRVAGHRKQERGDRRFWWSSDALVSHINRQISPEHETGVPGALRAAAGGTPLGLAVSVGCGTGVKERRLMRAGLVERFDLFEISPDQARRAEAGAREDGLGERVSVHAEDVFRRPVEAKYDLVYWDHALHHMFDVDAAIGWSIAVLRPGGLLLVNDYVGPTRLQWRRSEVTFARGFVAASPELEGTGPVRLRPGSPLRRLRMMYRDPSEAPQSDRIMTAFERRTGTPMTPLGGALIHMCGDLATRFEDPAHPIYARLIDWDQRALQRGMTHFAFGLWRKPA